MNAYLELKKFLSIYIADRSENQDEEAIQAYLDQSQKGPVLLQDLQRWRQEAGKEGNALEELGIESNRWFGAFEEADVWMQKMETLLQSSLSHEETPDGESIAVKDCHGTLLQEGDSVQVIQDLKVKGGSSDLKRGTVVKKIHLIGDPAVIECRVGGSTLVLKTCFLKRVDQ